MSVKVSTFPLPGTPAAGAPSVLRVARALAYWAPDWVEVVAPDEADVQVVHAIGADSMREVVAPSYAVVQYRHSDGGGGIFDRFWAGSRAVWSWFDLPSCPKLYLAPLGVEPESFWFEGLVSPRARVIATTGYVHGDLAEAIEEPAIAAVRLGRRVFHLGPAFVEGMGRRLEPTWQADSGIPDTRLRQYYASCDYVSGLRHCEAFELPVIEGFACGARPIVFDRPEMRRWFGDFAVFVPECTGEELVVHLARVMSLRRPVMQSERTSILPRFNWPAIAAGFWRRVLA